MSYLVRTVGLSASDFQCAAINAARSLTELPMAERRKAFRDLTDSVQEQRRADEDFGNLYSRLYEAARMESMP